MTNMSQPEDDYITRYLNWRQRRNNEYINNVENQITQDILNLKSNNNHHDSENETYHNLLRKMEKQIINGETSAKSLFDFNAPSLIAPNHEFWSTSNPSNSCKLNSDTSNKRPRSIEEIFNASENIQVMTTVKKNQVSVNDKEDGVIKLDNLRTKVPDYDFSKPSCYRPPPGFPSPMVTNALSSYETAIQCNIGKGYPNSPTKYQCKYPLETYDLGDSEISNTHGSHPFNSFDSIPTSIGEILLNAKSQSFESIESNCRSLNSPKDKNSEKKYDFHNIQVTQIPNKTPLNENLKANYFEKLPEFGNLVPSYPPPGYPKNTPNSVPKSKKIPTLNDLYDIDYQTSQLKCQSPSNHPEAPKLQNLNQEKKPTGVWMFVDNSNIWIECKRAEAKVKFRKNPLFDEDPRLRLDMGRLAEQVRGNRPIIDAQLYGSEPPEIDTIWQLATKRGWEVNRFKRNLISGKEKQLDTSIVADITELVCHSEVRKLKFEKYQNVIVLVAGDSDFIPAIRKVIAQNGWWRIEVWGLAQSMSNAIKLLSKEYPSIVQINYMDKEEIKKQFTFTHYKLDLKWNIDADIQVLLYNYGIVFEDVYIWLGGVVKTEFQQTIKGLQWPYKFCWMDDRKTKWDGSKNLLVLFERPNARPSKPEPAKEKFDFLSKYLPRLKNSKLKRLCGRILSYHEYDKETNDMGDSISLSNRFNCLTSIGENEDLFDLDIDDTDEEEQEGNLDTDVFNLTEDKIVNEQVISPEPPDDEWEQVINKAKSPKAQLYSTLCKYGAICVEGGNCSCKHTSKEKQIFEARRIAKSLYGHEFYENKYRTELCNKNWCDHKVCRFAHGTEQLICRICCKIGHGTESCSKKVET